MSLSHLSNLRWLLLAMLSNATGWSQAVDQDFIAAGLRVRKLEQQVESAFNAKLAECSKSPELLDQFQKAHSAWRKYLNHHLVAVNQASASGLAPKLSTTDMIELKAGLLGFRLQQLGGAESQEMFEQGEGDQEEEVAGGRDNTPPASIDLLSEVAGVKLGSSLSDLLNTKWATYRAQLEPGGTVVMEPASKEVIEEALKDFDPNAGVQEVGFSFSGDRVAKSFGFSISSLSVNICASPQDLLTPVICSLTISSHEDGFSKQLFEHFISKFGEPTSQVKGLPGETYPVWRGRTRRIILAPGSLTVTSDLADQLQELVKRMSTEKSKAQFDPSDLK